MNPGSRLFFVFIVVIVTIWAVLAAAQTQPAPGGALTNFHKVFVRSDTVYLKAELLQSSLRQQPQFATWKLDIALDPIDADLIVRVTRPFLTFDWTYSVSDAHSGQELFSGYVVASEGHRASDRIAAAVLERAAPARSRDTRPPGEVLGSLQTIHVESHTIYLKTEDLISALRGQPALQMWNLKLVSDPKSADVMVRVDRPFMSFDWVYTLKHPATAHPLATGTVVAWDGPTAAPLLAAHLVSAIGSVRKEPAAGTPSGPAMVPGENAWRVQAVSVGGVRPGTELNLLLENNTLVARDAMGNELLVPTSEIIAISHSSGRIPANSCWSFWESPVAGHHQNQLVLLPVLVPRTAEITHTDDHFVNVAWRSAGSIRFAEFLVPAEQHHAVLTALQSATRREWKDYPSEVAQVRQALQRETIGIPVEFDRPIHLGWTQLSAGNYRMVLLSRGAEEGELYVFSGDRVDISRVVAQALVEVSERKGTNNSVQVTYREENGLTRLAEVRTAAQTIRFTPVPLPPAQ